MKLFELFDTEAPHIDWIMMGDAECGDFRIGKQRYMVQMRPVTRGSFIHGTFKSNPPVTDNTYYYAFAPMDPRTGHPINTRLPTDTPNQVFGAVINIAVKYINDHGIDMLYYGGEKSDSVRLRVYKMITNRLTKKYNWELVGEDDASIMGTEVHFWFIRKK